MTIRGLRRVRPNHFRTPPRHKSHKVTNRLDAGKNHCTYRLGAAESCVVCAGCYVHIVRFGRLAGRWFATNDVARLAGMLVSASGMLLRGRVPSSQHHALAPRKGVFVADRQIGRVAELDQPRAPRFVACVDS